MPRRGWLQGGRRIACQRIIGSNQWSDQSSEHDQRKESKGEGGDGVLGQHIARVSERDREAGAARTLSLGRGEYGGRRGRSVNSDGGARGHASILTRGSIRP
jgi:hypothetical protein